MLLLANGIAGAESGLIVALGAISAVLPAILIAAAVLMLIKVKQQSTAAVQAVPATASAIGEDNAAYSISAAPAEAAEPEPPATEETAAASLSSGVPFPVYGKVHYKKSFRAKLIQSSDDVKKWYSELKNAFLSYKRTTSRLSWQADSINSGRTKLGKFTIRGKTLCLFLALDPDEYTWTKFKVERASGKRYEGVPCMYKIRGARRARYALELIEAVAEKYELVPVWRETVDYRLPYEDTQSLIDRGLIRKG